ncbi:MAG TPA: ATP-binding protein [Clostridia bacterium]|nr:ATP-binding protein [Clostridia bacterium]
MYFKKLEVKGFGKLKELTSELTEGMNIVYGNNESGKTSLQWFLKAMLYGLKGGKIFTGGLAPACKEV